MSTLKLLREIRESGDKTPYASLLKQARKFEYGGEVKKDYPPTVTYGTPEYKKAYESGNIAAYDKDNDTYVASLPEVEIKAPSLQGQASVRKGHQEFLSGALESISIPQKMMMKGITGKQQLPSEAWGFDTENKSWYNPKSLFNFAMDVVVDPLNLLGVGLLDDVGKQALKGVNKAGNKFLPNAYKLNPNAFKPNPDAFYRVVGNDAVEDALSSGLIRNKQSVNQNIPGTINIGDRPTAYPSFSKGKISTEYAKGLTEHGLIETNRPMNVSNLGRHGKGTTQFPVDNTGNYIKEFPVEQSKIYKQDWLKGYKEIDVPKQQFKSEINWGKWNKEIPENTQLMQEYNTIEQTSKANGTWMKNPDGSAFNGTPEQFVQQNSENFKKAFPEYHGEILNHNTNAELNTIDESFFNKGAGDTGYYGKGTYTHPKKDYTKMYGKNNHEFYLNSKNKGFLDKSNIDDAEYFKRSDDEILQHHLPEYENKLMNYELDPSRYYDNAKENWLNKLNEQVKAGKISRDKLDEFTSLHNPKNGEVVIPFNNRIKSAIGNNGMFDMSNPNIYKSLVPIAGASTILSQQDKIKKLKTK